MHVIFHVLCSHSADTDYPLNCNMLCECGSQEFCSVCVALWESALGDHEFEIGSGLMQRRILKFPIQSTGRLS